MNIRTLAKELALSKTTVARALQNEPGTSERTRKRVQEAARILGYTPNPVASTLYRQIRSRVRSRSKANLAVLFPSTAYLSLQLYGGTCQRARELGYSVELIHFDKYTPKRLSQILGARGVLGVMVFPMDDYVRQVELDWSQFAIVAYGYTLNQPDVHRVVHNHSQGIRKAFEMCRKRGFRRIGYAITQDGDGRSNGQWCANFIALQHELPAKDQVKPFVAPEEDYTPAKFTKWLHLERPEVILFHCTAFIPKLPRNIRKTFVSVVLGRECQDIHAGIDQQYSHCAGKLVDLLSQQILHNERGIPAHPTITMLPGIWVDHPSFRKST